MRHRSTRAHLGCDFAIKAYREDGHLERGQVAPCCRWKHFSRRVQLIPRMCDEAQTAPRGPPGIVDARVLACARWSQTLALQSPRFALFPWWQSIGPVMTMRLQTLSSIMVMPYSESLVPKLGATCHRSRNR